MPEESVVVSTEVPASTETLTPAEQREAVVMNQEDHTADAKSRPVKHVPFFEKEVSEAELMGGEDLGESEKPGADSVVTKEKPKEVPKEEAKKVEEVDENKGAKPPAGFVPKGALAEEREKRKEAQAEIERLRQQLATPVAEVVKPADEGKVFLKSIGLPEDFKVLNDAEEDALMEEDIFAYQKYQRNLRKAERASYEVQNKQRISKEITTRADQVVQGAVRRMETSVPGIHEQDSEINQNLTQFAISNGIEIDYLNALTDPKTMFLPAGAKQPQYLGDGAAALVEFIHNVYKTHDQTAVRAEQEKEIRAKVTAELMKKFKTSAVDKETFKSLGDTPGSMEVSKGKFSEKDFAKMTEEEERAALGG